MSRLSTEEILGTGKKFAVLIDPDRHNNFTLKKLTGSTGSACIDFFLVGGSLVSASIEKTIEDIRSLSELPVILFPGNVLQISDKADGILLLSLISGRNPEFLIGNHVIAAPVLKKTELGIIPTGYILVENGRTTSVEYMSNTKPIPADKTDLAVATAMAGEMLGHKLIYLEAGSGAKERVNAGLIREVSSNLGIPLMVGGGIVSGAQVNDCYKAGAEIVVVGSAFENNAENAEEFLAEVAEIKSGFNSQAPG